jgi:S-DNA-T family DNA segregation ATPase FtsK/SpoIIIE
MLERRGIISGYEGSKPRQVLVTEGELSRALARHGDAGGDDSPGSEAPSGDAPEQDERESVSSPAD